MSGVTHTGNDLPQQPSASKNALNPIAPLAYCSGEAKRKRGRKTNYHDEDEDERKDWEEDDDNASESEGKMSFQVPEAENTFLEIVFDKQLEAMTERGKRLAEHAFYGNFSVEESDSC